MTDDDNADRQRDQVARAAPRGPEAVLEVVADLSKVQAVQVIDEVINDYIAELNGALRTAGSHGLDGTSFMYRYNSLWNAKLALSRG